MRRATAIFFAIACMAGSLAAAATLPKAAPDVLSVNGWGKVRVGMSRRALLKALGQVQVDNAQSEGCELVYPAHGPRGVYVMVEDGKVTRVTVSGKSRIRTDKGLGLGSTEAEVRRAYGSGLRVETAPYSDEPAHVLTAWTRKDKLGIRYTTDEKGRVTGIDAGGSSIAYMEDCL